MTTDDWLRTHAYLEPIARFCARVDDTAAEIPMPSPGIPSWDAYAEEFGAGVPLLRSTTAAIELEPVGAIVGTLLEKLAATPSLGEVAESARALGTEMGFEFDAPHGVVDWLLGEHAFVPSDPGLLRHLGWRATARYLQPVLDSFARWRNEDRWLRSYCPACGALPAMGQLIGDDPGKKRLLSCGCCGTRWRYRRTACPFCETDSRRLGIVAVEGEGGLRIDYCESCRGYVKTYVGEGSEAVLLADWTSLHLDLIARDRGLERAAVSLYELEPFVAPEDPRGVPASDIPSPR